MTANNQKFQFSYIRHEDSEFWDAGFIDDEDGAELRDWVLTYDIKRGRFYANLRTSETVDDMFDHARETTADELARLIAAIPAELDPRAKG